MQDVLKQLSEKLNNLEYTEIFIDQVFIMDFCHDYSNEYKPIAKYENIFWSKERVIVTEEDADYFISVYSDEYHICIKIVLSYLIASCIKRQSQSDFLTLCDTFIDYYFNNISNVNNGFPPNNLSKILKWSMILYPNHKEIPRKYVSKVLECKINSKSLDTFVFLFNDEKLKLFLQEKDCNEFIDLILMHKDSYDTGFIYNALSNLLNVYKSNEIQKIIKKSICDYTLNNLNKFDKYLGHKAFNLVRDYMGEIRTYTDAQFELIDQELDKVNKEMLSGLKSTCVELPKEQMDEYKRNLENIDNYFKMISNYDRVLKILSIMSPVSKIEVKKRLDEEKKGILGFVSRSILDKNGNLINYKKFNEDEYFSLYGGQHINLTIQISMDLYYRAFVRHYKEEQEAIERIEEFFKDNDLLCEENGEGDYFRKLILRFFKGDYDYTFEKIIIQFEKSLRYYFKNNGLNIKKHSKNEFIGLSGFLNNNKTNKFRDKLLETIDEDYYFTLTWLLTDEYGMNYRGTCFHGLTDIDVCKTTNAIYASLLIIRMYLGFTQNKNK